MTLLENENPAAALRIKFSGKPDVIEVKKWLLGDTPSNSTADGKKVRKLFDKGFAELG